MADHESTMKWKVDIGDLTKAMQEAKRSIKVANAEFKTATAGMDRWSKSTDGLEAKLKQLNTTLPKQKQILNDLERQYELTAENMGENSKEAQDLRLKIEEQRATIVKTETNINKYNDQLEQMQKQQSESETASGKLNKTIEEQQKQVDQLKKEYKDAVLQYGENSKEAQALAKQIEDLSGELADNKKKLNDADKAADEFDKSLEDTKQTADDVEGGFTVLKGALANLVTQGINLVIDGLKNLASTAAEAWQAFDEGADIIIAKTGATGDAAKELQDVYKNVSKQVVGSYDEMGTAVGEINTRFGLTGDELEDLSVKFLKFAKLNGTDVNSSIDSVQAAMAMFGIESDRAGEVLDIMNKVGQDTGVSMDDLAKSLMDNGTVLKELGLDINQSANFLGNLEKNGIDSTAMMGGLKKAMQNAAKDGKTLDEAMADLQKEMQGAKSDTEAAQIAMELFGNKSGPAIAQAVRDGRLSFDDFSKSVENWGDSVDTTFENTLDAPDKFALAMQGIRTDMAEMTGDLMDKYAPQIESAIDTIANMAKGLFDAVDKGIDFFVKNGDTIIALITGIATATGIYLAYTTALKIMTDGWMALTVVQKLVAAEQAVVNAVMAANPIGLVIAAIAGLVAAFVVLWNKSEAFRNFWIDLWEKIKEAASIAKEKISEWIENIKEKFQEFSEKASEIKDKIVQTWENIKAKTGELKDKVVGFFEGIRSGIADKIAKAKESVSTAVEKIKEFLSFSGLKKKVSELFEGIKDKITSPIDKAKELVDKAVGKIKGFFPIKMGKIFSGIKLPHFNISGGEAPWGIGGKGKKPSIGIDWYAKGGVFDKGATIVGLGENGAEAIVPLERNTKWISRVVKEMVDQLDATGAKNALLGNVNAMNGNSASGEVVQNVTFNQYNTSPKALSRLELYRDTQSMLFSAKVRLSNV